MTNLPGPGLPQRQYLDLLVAGHETGWWDDHGTPAHWPEDLLDPDSDWQQSGGETTPPDPGEPPF